MSRHTFLIKSRLPLLLSLTISFSLAASAQNYDEVHDEKGLPRETYADILPYLDKMTPIELEKFRIDSTDAFGGDNQLSPKPRVMSAEEYDATIVKGVSQRGSAILAFLKDHYSGEHRYKAVINEAVVDRIIERNGEAGFEGLIDPSTIAFPYGPDLIRDASGQWRVVEDNLGFIGGPGDLITAQDFLFQANPELKKAVEVRDPRVFYKRLTDLYKARAAMNGGKPIMLFSSYESDSEDDRQKKIMKEYGIESVDSTSGDLVLKIQKDGVYTYSKSKVSEKSLEKVGYIVLQGDHNLFDLSHPAIEENVVEAASRKSFEKTKDSFRRRALKRAFEMKRGPERTARLIEILGRKGDRHDPLTSRREMMKPFAGLETLILKKKVLSNYSPGVDFVGDKEFYVYVDKLIKFYLNEKPILKNIETVKLADARGNVRTDVMDKVFGSISDFVVKRVDGRGGDAVYIGPKMTKDELATLRERIVREPDFYIAQKFSAPSMIDDHIVDMRAISDVATDGVTVANVGWGRGTPNSGNGKVNISGVGKEYTVLVREDVPSAIKGRAAACRAAF